MDIDELKNSRIHTAFLLGMMIAEHVHETDRTLRKQLIEEKYRALQEVANGNLTLHDSPYDKPVGVPSELKKLEEKMPAEVKPFLKAIKSAGTQLAMESQRDIAVDLVVIFKSFGWIK